MKRRRGLVLAVVAGLVLGVGIWFVFFRNPEPRYNGKRLTQWCLQLEPLPRGNGGPWTPADAFNSALFSTRSQTARDAIWHIGPKAVPWLLRWLTNESPAWQRSLVYYLPPGPLGRRLQERFQFNAMRRMAAARGGFQTLGPAAVAAAPELARIMMTSTNVRMAFEAQSALESIGELAAPQLVDWLNNATVPQRRAILSVIDYRWGLLPMKDADLTAQALVRCAGDDDEKVALEAIRKLAFGGRARLLCRDVAVAGLTNALADVRDSIRVEALASLRQFGPEADAAVPALRRALHDPNAEVREYATNGLLILHADGLQGAPTRGGN